MARRVDPGCLFCAAAIRIDRCMQGRACVDVIATRVLERS